MVGPEHDLADQLSEARIALRADIGFGGLHLLQDPLGLLHRAKDRRVAVAVAIDADADVDLGRPRIGLGERDQRDEGIRRLGFQPVEQQWSLLQGRPPVHERFHGHAPIPIPAGVQNPLNISLFAQFCDTDVS